MDTMYIQSEGYTWYIQDAAALQLGEAPSRLYIFGRLGSRAPRGPGRPGPPARQAVTRIYHVYTMYMYIYVVYTRHIPGIYRKSGFQTRMESMSSLSSLSMLPPGRRTRAASPAESPVSHRGTRARRRHATRAARSKFTSSRHSDSARRTVGRNQHARRRDSPRLTACNPGKLARALSNMHMMRGVLQEGTVDKLCRCPDNWTGCLKYIHHYS
jgi:hypothetical protein